MKKNKMLRMASALLVMTLLTTSIIGGTYAKYVTTDSAQDAARVAKFGVVATVAGDLFGSTYKAGTDNGIMSYDVGGTVKADDAADKVVAPGTQNREGLTLSVKGTPEVSTKVLVGDAKDSNGTYVNSDIYLAKGKYGVMVKHTGLHTAQNIGNYYTKNADGNYIKATDPTAADVYELRDVVDFTAGADYYPLTWYYNNHKVEGQTTKVREVIAGAFNQAGAPNVAYNALIATVGWEWEFSDAANGVISDKDRKDTILGKMIADKSAAEDVVCITDGSIVAVTYKDEQAATGSANSVINAYAGENGAKVACLTVSFNISLTVEQVD